MFSLLLDRQGPTEQGAVEGSDTEQGSCVKIAILDAPILLRILSGVQIRIAENNISSLDV